jgi:exodeoxyribonuclease V gamma subunit
MPGLTLYAGNRLETLVDQLAEILRVPLSSPLETETIVVQSQGMERWISMELARRHGICANIRFPFPNAVVDEVFRTLLGDLPDPSPFDPTIMTWKIMRVLPSCVAHPGFETLNNYLAGNLGQLKQFQLAQRIANLFDQYLLFRPEMMLAWEDSPQAGGDWQPLLWRELAKGLKPVHRAALRQVFLEKIHQMASPPQGLPQRLSIFGISALPPFHMEVFSELARFIRVHLFLMNPCREYWADIRSEREMDRITRHQGRRRLAPEDLHLEAGNSLLASMGTLGRDFFHLIQDTVGEEQGLFQEPGEGSLLACIQTDILHLTERDAVRKTCIGNTDRSIMIHSCHSPMREIEVLYDQLLALFEEEPDLGPRDVLVMTPDINVYAPFIHTVFDAPELPAGKIPFSITDRSLRKESQIIEAFLAVLDLAGSRLGAPQLLALLESAALRRRFGLTETDVPLIHRWVNDTRIRWGIDGDSRAAMGFGAFTENTWQAGLDRLLLGYALPGGGDKMYQNILPYDLIEGSDAAVLGNFVQFTQRLFAAVAALAHPRPLKAWATELNLLLDGFFAPDADSAGEAQLVRQAVNDLTTRGQAAGFEDPLTVEVVKSWLGQRLDTAMLGLGFITGGVTFCAMLPMRSIPFPIICLVGMDDGAFPRQSRSLGFDLMARTPQRGDRSQRSDDRYLFLEALLSARRRLSLSYVGQSPEDNSVLPPSVLVSELLDVIHKGFALDDGSDIVEHITTRHKLQPFSAQYFKQADPRFFSYSAENCRAVQDARIKRAAPQPFISARIGTAEEEWRHLDVDQLTAFFTHPARFLLTRRLQVQLETREAALEDRENFDLDGLEQYLLAQQLVDRRIAGQNLDSLFPLVKASGGLPHGTVGRCRYDLLSGSVESFVAAIEPFVQAAPLPPASVGLVLPPFQLTGRIDHLSDLGLVHFRNARIKAKDRLNLWIRHLVLSAQHHPGYSREAFLIGKEGVLHYAPVDNAAPLLANLLAIYWDGLERPLPFFPQSSYAYARQRMADKSRDEALRSARSEWEPGVHSNQPGEGQDPYLQLCFAQPDPLDEEFERLAMEIFQSLLDYQSTMR